MDNFSAEFRKQNRSTHFLGRKSFGNLLDCHLVLCGVGLFFLKEFMFVAVVALVSFPILAVRSHQCLRPT